MRIIEITPEYKKAVDAFIKEEWAGSMIVSKGPLKAYIEKFVK